MLDSGMGSEVDSSGAVFRVNQAPTRQHEGDVGRTTAVRVLNNAWSMAYGGLENNRKVFPTDKLPLERNVTLVLTRTNFRTFKTLTETLRARGRRDVRVRVLSQSLLQRAREVMVGFRMMADRIKLLENKLCGKEKCGEVFSTLQP